MSDGDERADKQSGSAAGPTAESAPGPGRYVMLLLSAVLAALITLYFFPGEPVDRVLFLRRPVSSSIRVFERDLEVADALRDAPPWLEAAATFTFDSTARALPDAIDGLFEVLNSMRKRELVNAQSESSEKALVDPIAEAELQSLPSLQARLAVLLFEAGRAEEARFVLDELAQQGGNGVVSAIRAAYATSKAPSDGAEATRDLALLGDGWTSQRLRARLAERMGRDDELHEIEHSIDVRRAAVRRQVLVLSSVFVLLLACGLVLIFAWIWKNHPDLALSNAPVPPPWDWPAGLSVLVRSALFGIAISLVLRFLDARLGTEMFSLRGSVLVWAPMLWFMHKRLLQPAHLDFANAFGFARAFAKPALCIGTALGLLALDRIGASALQVLAAHLGERAHWTERVLEEWLWAPIGVAAFGILELVLFAPIFEELGCRGLLYMSLRRRLGPWSAAIFSAGLFALIHPYGMAGLLEVFWSGIVYALVYERTKSLVPLCLCHLLQNLFALTAGWMLYR